MTEREILQKKFRVFIFLSLFILAIEVVGSIFTNSLALLGDAGHVLVDSVALILAYFAMHISKRDATKKFTFGFYRAEILSAILNGLILIFITLYIFYEAYTRFLSPQSIKGTGMLAISIIGLLGNLYLVIKMRDYQKENLNMRGAYLNVVTDSLSSFGVVIAAILISLTGNFIFDPIISVIIGIIIVSSSFRLMKDAVHVLMEGAPEKINLDGLQKDIQAIKGVKEVHDLHIWSITSDVYSLSSHILLDAKNVKSINKIVSKINEMLESKYKITHTVIQSECEGCVDINKRQKH